MPSLFARLRSTPSVSNAPYDAAVNAARLAHWYRAGEVPDTMDGRFGLLSTIVALLTLRLERDGDGGNSAAVALTEAFIADMDAQMREQGFDATLGKQVRHMVGSLASRVDRWRRVTRDEALWGEATRLSLYRDAAVPAVALDHSSLELQSLWARLDAADLATIAAGTWS